MRDIKAIMGREVVGIAQRKTVGNVSDVIVDCDDSSVSHFVVESADGMTKALLPFSLAIGVGNDYIVVDDWARDASNDDQADAAIAKGFDLLGTPIVAASGNAIGTADDYEIDEHTGAITKLISAQAGEFSTNDMLFVSPEYAFVNAEGVQAQKPVQATEAQIDREAEEFLLGSVLIDDVKSSDGLFHAEAGGVITAELLADAQKHDAVVALAAAVDAL